MIVKPPKTFEYNDSTRNLFLFYQLIMDMTFNFAPDSYKVSVHNSHTLIIESYRIYNAIKDDKKVDKYYEKYIPTIIDEILNSLTNDKIMKKILGFRYDEYVSILKASKCSRLIFENNILNLLSFFNNEEYFELLSARIGEVIFSTSYQKELYKLTNNWLCELKYHGYSQQHINRVTNGFFNNNPISSVDSFNDYIKLFDFKNKEWEILFFSDKKLIEYFIESLHEVITTNEVEIELVTEAELKRLIKQDGRIKWVEEFKKNSNKLNKSRIITISKAKVIGMDPYIATKKLKHFLKTISDLITIFDNERKVSNDNVVCLNYEYNSTINYLGPMNMRARTFTSYQLNEVTEIIKKLDMSRSLQTKFLEACSFHNDAILQEDNYKYILIILWTALEVLFDINTSNYSKFEMVKESLIAVVQRTYISKLIKNIQIDVLSNLKIKNKELIEKYNINDTRSFIDLLFDDDNSERIKEVKETLEDNPLLCLRLHILINQYLRDGKKINNLLQNHRQKIDWQIDRIYRSRNVLVHSGSELVFNSQLVENLHNYYDFIIKYILSKASSKKAAISINNIIQEVKLDNIIHEKILARNMSTKTKDNLLENLFGPSDNVLNDLKELFISDDDNIYYF